MKNSLKKIIVIVLGLLIISVVIVLLSRNKDRKEKFVLDKIYDVYPEEVRELYSNMVNVSCNGDIHFDIAIDAGEIEINNINKNNLLDYMFSYMDKFDLLSDEINESSIKEVEKDIFGGSIDLINNINSYQYDNYLYNFAKGKITREKVECNNSDKQYVLFLYGYFHDDNKLSLDINVSYLKDGILYDLDDNKLGEYDGNSSKLFNLTEYASYYRVSYIKENDKYKLFSIQWKHND